MFLLSDADDTTSRPSSSIPSGFAQLVAALPQVINVSVDHDSAADDGVLAGEGDHGVSDVILSIGVTAVIVRDNRDIDLDT